MNSALIIDGHNYLFKAYYGVTAPAKRPDGTPINAIYGFFSLLRSVNSFIDANYLIIAFDTESSIDDKVDIEPDYKAQRAPIHDDVYSQLPLIKACLDILNIEWIDDLKYEADDLIGAYSSMFKELGLKVFIASNDYDFIQLIDNSVSLLRAHHGKVTKFESTSVVEMLGIEPTQYLDYLALKGDVSDNISGIKGIGRKRAASLVERFIDIEGIYDSIDKLPTGLQKSLDGKKDFLLDKRTFYRIVGDTSICLDRSILNYAYSEDSIPERMGYFLNGNWEEIVKISKDYL
jgi:DNA polymerase-1